MSANLSSLFAAPQGFPAGRPTGFESGQKAAQFKRQIVMREAMQQDLAPDDGEPFFEFTARRLFELGDTEGAFAVTQKAQEFVAARAEAEQQSFANQLAAARNARDEAKLGLDISRVRRESLKGETISRIATRSELEGFGITDPKILGSAIEIKERNGQIVGFESLSGGGTDVTVEVDARSPQVGGIEATKPTLNKLQEQVMSSNESISRLTQISETFDESFLQLGTRLQEFGGRMRDFLGRATPEDQALITAFQDFKSTALDNLNLTLNQLSGAAVSPQEFKRISNALPNPGTGLFDGDSPTQFISKARRAMRDMKLARARANFILSGGGTLEDIQSGKLTINGMAAIMQKKIDDWDKAGLNKTQIAEKLRDTFGDF